MSALACTFPGMSRHFSSDSREASPNSFLENNLTMLLYIGALKNNPVAMYLAGETSV